VAGKLTFYCGKMAAGKSTHSMQLAAETCAVLLSEDAWLSAHYPNQISSPRDYVTYSDLIKPFVQDLVIQILQSGCDVVMDFPGNTVQQRQWLLDCAQLANASHDMIYLDVADEECLSRLTIRREEHPERAQFDTPEVFQQITQYFEPPSADEGINIIRRSD